MIACDSDRHQDAQQNREQDENWQGESSEKISAASDYTAEWDKEDCDGDEDCGLTEGFSEARAIVADVSDGCGDKQLYWDEGIYFADESFSGIVREGAFPCVVFFFWEFVWLLTTSLNDAPIVGRIFDIYVVV